MNTRARVGLAIVGLAVAATAALAVIGWPGRLYRDSDYMQYYAGSRALLEGASPYDHAWWAEFHQRVESQALSAPPRTGNAVIDWTTPYPLPTFVALLPFAVFPLRIAGPLFAAAQVALLVGAVLALAAAVLPRPRRDAGVALALVASSQPFWVLIAGGNVTGFAAAACGLALASLLTGRPRLAGALLAGCLVKPHLFAFVAIVLLVGAPRHARRRLVIGGLVGAAVLVVPAFILQPGWVGDWLREAGWLQETSASNATGWTIARPFVADFRLWSALLIGACVAGFIAWWVRARPELSRLVAAALPVSVLIAPHGWSYDYIALVPSVVVGVAIASESARRIVGLLVLAVLVVLGPWILYLVAFRRNGEDLSAWLLVAAEVLFITLARRR